MTDDFEVLREHIERGSEEAFRTLVERHSGMVHGVAFRVVGNDHLAQEITQAVFVILARKASSLRRGTILAGWLYRSARFVALEALRAEQRRQQHHERFAQMNSESDSASVWDQISPFLEEAMSRLAANDRDALVLRFLEERSFTEVAGALGTTEAAAKMRVGRALEKLRGSLVRHGVAVPAAALLAALSAHAASAGPAGLSATITTAALTQQGAAGSLWPALAKGGLKIMAWNKIKSGAIACAIALLLAGGGFVLWQRASAGSPIVASFAPMRGDWEGTFETRGDGIPSPIRQPVALTIRTSENDRLCEIEMRVPMGANGAAQVYQFSHSLNESGNRIVTVDDPKVGRVNGEGKVTESIDNRQTGEWRAAFQTRPAGLGLATHCRWVCKGDELIITRHDETIGAQGTSHLYSDLKLRRRPAAAAIP
jgi:RNA polymerase sigma factor (sigma-70 family)